MCLAASELKSGVLQYWKNSVEIRLRTPGERGGGGMFNVR